MKDVLTAIIGAQILSEAEAFDALRQIMSGEIAPAQISAFLAILQTRGIHLSELRGFHSALSASGIRVDLQEPNLMDVCGTGGDGKGTFNISTLAAFVLAGAGVKVAKHGNYSATSGSGSSDVLEFFGVKFTNDEEVLRRNLSEANICYLHAPLFQPALKSVAPVRREIGFRTFFNILGPLINPARPRFQFVGVAEPAILRLYRYFFEDGDVDFAVIHSRSGYDEISLTGAFDVATNDGVETFYPEDLGLKTVQAKELQIGKNIEEAAENFTQILKGKGTPVQEQVVIANAAFAMRLVQPDLPFGEYYKQAAKSLHTGAALRSFELLCEN